MIDYNTMAEKLYPSMAPAPKPEVVERTREQKLDALYGSLNDGGRDQTNKGYVSPLEPKPAAPKPVPKTPEQPKQGEAPQPGQETKAPAQDTKAGEAEGDKADEGDDDHETAYWTKLGDEWRVAAVQEFGEDADFSGARQVVQTYGDKELVELLTRYQAGNHPAVLRFMRRVAEALDHY